MKRRKNSLSSFSFTLISLLISFRIALIAAEEEPILIDFDQKPQDLVQVTQEVLQSQREFNYYVIDENEEGFNYTLFIRLHNMSAKTCKGDDSPRITIDVDGADGGTINICHPDYSHDNGMTGNHYYFADHNVTISATGLWGEEDYANLYVSIFYETDSCSNKKGCKLGGFCCRGCKKRIMIDRQEYFYESQDEEMLVFLDQETISKASSPPFDRCIPSKLKCNKVPSCGDICNFDESSETCSVSWGCYYGYSTECWSMGFVWTALIAVLFFVLAPTAIVFLICYNGQLAMLRRARMAQESRVTVNSPPNDLPPTYDEVEEPPPCFCSVIDPTIGMGPGNGDANGSNAGVINFGFEPTESTDTPVPKSMTCQCAKQELP